jgi:hypothetical protein
MGLTGGWEMKRTFTTATVVDLSGNAWKAGHGAREATDSGIRVLHPASRDTTSRIAAVLDGN